MIEGFEFKPRYTFGDLVAIMTLLRGENGCPWDREQTHESIRKNLIEETYEVVEAIDNKDRALLREELGDVLLQVVFHAEMERQAGGFDIGDVSDGICRKLIERHPHIFGDVSADTSAQVLKNWDEIKKREKGQSSQAEVLETVPRVLPALMRSHKVQQKAAKSGFDWPDVSGAIEKTHEELGELEQAVAAGEKTAAAQELGDLLFSVVNVARFIGAEPEESLTWACDKFIARFTLVERLAKSRGIEMRSASPAALDALWEEAKLVL
ncbi:MAG: nucleoside triphosphate pyrophosphohydrolase [Clostridia bacterium]|nr:nucleoside triphosphate pyrophosphohydrolase [Clostridia bacterium]